MDDLRITDSVTIPGWELWMTTSTSGGPGGQHANKSETRVTVHFEPASSSVLSDSQKARIARRLASSITSDGVLQVSSGKTRSQHRNRDLAREQLAELLKKGLSKPRPRKRTRIPRSQKRRRLRNKRHRSRVKDKRKDPTRDDW